MALTDVFGWALLKIGADLAPLKKAMGQAAKVTAKSMKSMAGETGRFDTSAKSLVRSIKGVTIASSAAATALGSVKLAAILTASAFEKASKEAERLQISTKQFSALAHMANVTGVEINILDEAISLLARSVHLAPRGINLQSRSLKELGISVDGVGTSYKDTLGVMIEIADKFEKTGSETQKTAIILDLFGRSGLRLLPMLNRGGDAMRQAARDTVLFGTAISDADAAMGEKFIESWRILKEAIKGATFTLGRALIPAMNKMIERFLDFYRENAKLIKGKIFSWAKTLLKVVTQVASSLNVFRLSLMDVVPVLLEVLRWGTIAFQGIKFAIAKAQTEIARIITGLVYHFEQSWFAIRNAGQFLFASIKLAAIQSFEFILDKATDLAEGMIDLFGWMAPDLAKSLQDGLDGLDDIVGESVDAAKAEFKRLQDEVFEPSDMLKGLQDLVSGFEGVTEGVIAESEVLFDNLAGAIDNADESLAQFTATTSEFAGEVGPFKAGIDEMIAGFEQGIVAGIGSGFAAIAAAVQKEIKAAGWAALRSLAGFQEQFAMETLKGQLDSIENWRIAEIRAIEELAILELWSKQELEDKKAEIEDIARERKLRAEKAHQRSITSLNMAALGAVGSMMGSIASMQDTTNRQGFERAKKLQVGAAIATAIQGAVNAYTSTAAAGPWGVALAPIMAAAALAAGMANVAKIRSTRFEGGAGGGGGMAVMGSAAGGLDEVPRDGTMMVHGGEAIVPRAPARRMRALADALPATTGEIVDPGAGGGSQSISEIPIRLEVTMTGGEGGIQQAIMQGLNFVVRDLDGRLASSAVKGLSGGA